jgi:hypothetical protein
VQILIAAAIVIAIGGLALVGGAAFLLFRHIRTETITADAADVRLSAARARFAGQQPLIAIDESGDAVIKGRSSTDSQVRLTTLRALAFDATEGHIVDVSIPFWLLRLAPDGRISFDSRSGLDFDAERLNLNVGALEALGPGLVIDHADAKGTKLLVWTE